MAYTNFKPEFWAEKVERDNAKLCVLKNLCYSNYEGTLRAGTSVHISGIGAVTINDYSGTITAEELTDTSVELAIDKKKYFAVKVDDVDKIQAVEGLTNAISQEAAEGLAEQEDSDIAATLLADSAVTTAIGKAAQQIASVTPSNARLIIHQGVTILRKEGVKKTTTICAVVTPEFYEKLAIKNEEINTNNTNDLKNGFDAKVAGVEIYVSNNLPQKAISSTNYDVIYMFTKDRAIAHVGQIQEVEACRPSGSFSDLLKGLNVYGTKVVRPKELTAFRIAAYANS